MREISPILFDGMGDRVIGEGERNDANKVSRMRQIGCGILSDIIISLNWIRWLDSGLYSIYLTLEMFI